MLEPKKNINTKVIDVINITSLHKYLRKFNTEGTEDNFSYRNAQMIILVCIKILFIKKRQLERFQTKVTICYARYQ